MSRLCAPWLITTLSFGACALAQGADPWRLDGDAVDRFIAEYLDRNGVPGVAVVVTNGDDVVYAKGYGHDSAGRPVSSTTALPIASLSKAFTALAVMQLAEEGKLDLDDPIRRYLDDFLLADSRADRITIRQVLAHTSGMSDMAFPEKSVPTPASLEAAIALLRDAPLAAEPGTRRFYHNPNYWIAARLVEVVSGKKFDEYLKERILGPLGMRDTFAVVSLSAAPNVANGYVRLFGHPISLREPSWFLGGCCGVVTTAEDMGKWLAFHDTGATSTGERLISPAGLEEMHRGLGWNALVQAGRTTFTHNGILFTFSARQYLLPDLASGVGIAVMANTGIGLSAVDSDAIAQAVAAIAEGRPPASSGPSGLLVDSILVSLSVIAVLLGTVAVRRADRWANARRRRARWRIVLAQVPCLVPVGVLAFYPYVIPLAAGGRDVNWIQSLYLSVPLFTFVAVWATGSIAVVVARFSALRRMAAATRSP